MLPPVLRPTLLRLAGLILLAASLPVAAGTARVTDVRLWSGPEGTRLVIELSAPAEYDVFALDDPHRVVVDLANTTLPASETLPAGQGPVKALRSGPQAGHGLRFVLDVTEAQQPTSFVVGPDGTAGHRLVVELPGKPTSVIAPATPTINEPTLPSPVKSATGVMQGRDLVIAIDAGHGGQDPGALGRGGTREKDVTLAIARKLVAEIDAEEGMRAVLVREGDYFITLGARTRKARQLGADMFISIHADSVANRAVSGSSVYVLSLRGASDEAARWLAESENAADLKGGVSVDEGSDVLASVLLDVTQKESISDSVEAADSVLDALSNVGNVHGSARVRHAGFMVLKSPDIPSMLVETAFISNAEDERRLRDPGHQQRVAAAVKAGIRDYWYDNPPPGSRLAAIVAAQRGGGAAGTTAVAVR